MESINLLLKLPQCLSWFPTSLTVEKSLPMYQILMPWHVVLPPNSPVCNDALYVPVIRDLDSDWCSLWLPTSWVTLVFMKRFQHAHMKHRVYLEFCWQLKFVGHLGHPLKNSKRSLVSTHKSLVNPFLSQHQMQLYKYQVSFLELCISPLTISPLLGTLGCFV